MANTPLPQRLLAFLNPDGKTVALPWWRWFQQFEGGTGTGTPGPEGPAGPQGAQGPSGAQDDILALLAVAQANAAANAPGVVSAGGSPGPQGDDGEDGAIGPPGVAGASGPTGPTGPTGSGGAGSVGPMGPPGTDGVDGEDGMPIPGVQGAAGATGPTGPTGSSGAGTIGPMGPPGFDGDQGEPGPIGIGVTSVSLSTPLGGGTVTTSGTLGTSSYTQHGVLLGEGSSALAVTSAGSSGQRLRVPAGGGDPAFASTALLTIIQRTTNQSITNNTTTTISWDTTAVQDDVSAFSGASPTILTVPAGYTKVRITAYACWASNSTGPRGMHIDKNGTVLEGCQYAAANESPMHFTTRWLTVATSDTLSLGVFQQSGGALNFVGTTNFFTQPPYIQAEWAA